MTGIVVLSAQLLSFYGFQNVVATGSSSKLLAMLPDARFVGFSVLLYLWTLLFQLV
ncbi:hypothetical protein GCM10027217_11140 [Pseudomaricurvus hydrocarbonicus]